MDAIVIAQIYFITAEPVGHNSTAALLIYVFHPVDVRVTFCGVCCVGILIHHSDTMSSSAETEHTGSIFVDKSS